MSYTIPDVKHILFSYRASQTNPNIVSLELLRMPTRHVV